MGHVGRCAALAQALIALNWDVRIFVADRVAVRWARSIGVKTTRRPAGRWSLVVLDSYRAPSRVARSLLRAAATTAAVDDLHRLGRGSVDLVIRPSIGERAFDHVLGGPDFILLRNDYWRRQRRTISKNVKRVLVALGGQPHVRLLLEIVTALREVLPDIEIVVAGHIAGSTPPIARVRFVGRVRSLRPLLLKADIAVTAGGQTMNEALACGTPTMVLGTASNQRRNVSAARRAHVAYIIGWSSGRSWRSALRSRAARLAARYPERVRLARNARSLVDGRGALRVARLVSSQ